MSNIKAILGPTNTGKTHVAIERMCAHSSGVMGFPLRLLAREIYDRLVRIKGEAKVALLTGEERIEPPTARYYCCTAESMPIFSPHMAVQNHAAQNINGTVFRDFAFAAIDEAQLGADPERGHIFTDRLLNVRGREETMILGSHSLSPIIRDLIPKAEISSRPRFSTLSYGGPKKLSRLPKRSAIVAFSVEEVYRIAELLRRFRGGAAIVMGSLSPGARNAQVEMFQSGEVDYLVATDAIGMGLNLDFDHLAFASLIKFDGRKRRRLTISEMAQIAGRAGRHQKDGSFGPLSGECEIFRDEEIAAIEAHEFPLLDNLYWRRSELDYSTIETLIDDLETPPTHHRLRSAPPSLDIQILKNLANMPAIADQINNADMVKKLWQAASLPDFRGIGVEPHSRFVAGLWRYLGQGSGRISGEYFAKEIDRLDKADGDIEILTGRLQSVRSWNYIAQRPDWVDEPGGLRERAGAVEARLSENLHRQLRERFVNRRTSVLLRQKSQFSNILPVKVDKDGQILVDGESIGTLDGFQFIVDANAKHADRKIFEAAAQKSLGTILKERAFLVQASGDDNFTLNNIAAGQAILQWNDTPLGTLEKGKSLLQPEFRPHSAVAGLEADAMAAVVERAKAWIDAQITRNLAGVKALDELAENPEIDGAIRALAAQLADAGGVSGRAYLSDSINAIAKENRGAARKAGIVFGALDIFHHAALKPGAARWRSYLSAIYFGKPVADLPPESAVHLTEWNFASNDDCRNAGYRRVGNEYLRIDLAERIVKKAHEARGKGEISVMDMTFATSLGLSNDALTALMRDAGFKPAEAHEVTAEPVAEVNADSAKIDNGDIAASEVAIAEAPATEAPSAEAEVVAAEVVAAEVAPAEVVPVEIAPEAEAEPSAEADAAQNIEQKLPPTYWKWVGIRRKKFDRNNNAHKMAERGDRRNERQNKKPGHKNKHKGPRDDMPRFEPKPRQNAGHFDALLALKK
ncbi:hypothetical protein LPB140_05880 [Sphingorhabdus lutea]|uniref:Helicase C-terminal domain-containing protein n=1 Tax=Sphingorhabdus lutea TaxID=1913578 RepID=A0A1L3JB97_9SPHN|nr:helicase-related protein [Sphingorhabdus lutea]APG62402.1 hypothetical protein LPB140_05880 [Sphingorhabdus lutea]